MELVRLAYKLTCQGLLDNSTRTITTPAPVIDPAATIAGLVPTADEVAQAQATLTALIARYETTDKSEELEAFLLNTIYAA